MSGFSSKETLSLEKTVDIGDEIKLRKKDEIPSYYDLDKCVNWINEINAQKICLQFPDSLLGDSVEVVLSLKKRITGQLYVLGDTSYGSCCVDEVAAQHVNADAIIHFGKACLSPTGRLPVLYVFEKYQLDVDNFVSSFQTTFSSDSKVLILYEVYYAHIIDALYEKLAPSYGNVVMSRLITASGDEKLADSNSLRLLGREFTLAKDSSLGDYQIVFIGKDGRTLSNFFMDTGGAKFYLYDPDAKPAELSMYEYQGSKFLMRRMYLVERVKDARTLGIVIGTLGVSNYLGAVDRMKQLAKRYGKKSYIIAVGKPNVPKLANFPEIDIFVLIACSENCLLDSKEFYKPIVTPYEVELALNPKQEFGQTYVTDFRELLPGGRYYNHLEENPAPNDEQLTDISLISGQLRHMEVNNAGEEEVCDDDTSSTVAVRGDTSVSTLSSGGDFLTARSWQGLEQKLGQTEVTSAARGRSGIPQHYNSDLEAADSGRS